MNYLSQNNTLQLGDKGAVKDLNLKLVDVALSENAVLLTLERPYYSALFRQGGLHNIKAHSNVNLLTVNQINFTKGYVLKKHLVVREKEGDQKFTGVSIDKENTYLVYVVQFNGLNARNLSKEAMGGLEPGKVPWSL